MSPAPGTAGDQGPAPARLAGAEASRPPHRSHSPRAHGSASTANRSPALVLTLYSKPDCHLCVDAREALERVCADIPFELREIDITSEDRLHRAYFERIPVVALEGEELFEYFVQEHALRERLAAIL
ncbi:MAG TPA: glutaredoxin family protein [Solirubrobacteraceae bacterium]